jgi:O-antigen ligase
VSFVFWLVPSLPAAGDNERGVLLRNHVTQGMAMVAGVVLAALDWKASGARGAWRASLAAMIALMLANIALICVGRSAHVALLVASAALALLLSTPGRRWRALLVVPVAALVVLVSSPMVRERFAGGWNELGTVNTSATETSMGLRVVIWKTTLGIIRDHPLFGVGAGSFAPSYAARIHAEATGWQAAEAKDTHNQYLHVQVEAGALGSVAFIAMAWMLSRRRGASPWREGGVALLLAWLATSLFNSHFENFAEAHLIGVLLGLLLAPAAYADGIPGSASSRRAADSTSP